MKRAVFLDRDGVINRVMLKNGRPYSPRKLSDFQLTGGIEQVLTALKEAGFLVIVVTNQPDVSRGLISRSELEAMLDFIRRELHIDDIFVCPHDDADNCDCRKPKPGMIIQAAEKWGVDTGRSFIIGDTWKDMEAGRRAGCTTILLNAPYNHDVTSDYRVDDISGVLNIIRV